MSIQAMVFKQMVKAGSHRTLDIEVMRKEFASSMKNFKVPKDVELEDMVMEGVPVEWAFTNGSDRSRVILFLHGGSHCIGSVETHRHFTAGLAKESHIPVLSLEYRLAPQNPYPAAMDDVLKVYGKLLETGFLPTKIVFLGDSSGAGLGLAAAMKLRDTGQPVPGGVALLSPWTDLTMSSESYIRNAHRDPVNYMNFDRKCGRAYANGQDLKDPLISPLFGDFRGLPPLFIHVGTEEISTDDAVKTADKARKAGLDVTYRLWKGMFHDFTIFYPLIPEGKESLMELIEFIDRNTRGPVEGKTSTKEKTRTFAHVG